MKTSGAAALTLAEKCKHILLSNWEGRLNTIQADSSGSKSDVYTSKVKYLFKKGKPYIWVPEKEKHNVNTLIDERGSFAVTSPFPGSLGSLLKSINKFPARVALTGDVIPLENEKEQVVVDSLMSTVLSEQKAISDSSYSVAGIISSSKLLYTSRSEHLQELLDGSDKYVIYKFNIRSCTFMDCSGGTHEIALEDIQACKADTLSSFSAKIVDGINRSEARRRALVLLCLIYLNANPRDACVFSVDRKGLDILGRAPGPLLQDGSRELKWKEFRLGLKKEAIDVETFCKQLVEMEEEALDRVKGFSGLA